MLSGKQRWIITGVIICAMVLIAIAVQLARRETSLEFVLRDAVSRHWVWDATITLQDRVIRSYYQSDRGPIQQRFSGLRPGSAELRISAPSYEPLVVPLTLTRGANTIPQAIEMTGYEIANLERFVVFPVHEGPDVALEIRPVGRDGRAIENHPPLPVWIGARVSSQERDPVEGGAVRGEELFRGRLQWEFDTRPETLFRYRARLPAGAIARNPAQRWVIDYLIVVPDTREIDAREMDRFMDRLIEESEQFSMDPAGLFQDAGLALEAYFYTSWDVEARR